MLEQLTYDEVFTYEHLFDAFKKSKKGVAWKGTVQSYDQHSISRVSKTYQDLKQRKVKTGHFFHFDIMERGKTRHIKSVGIDERVIQRCLCDYSLVPILSSKFIYDNSACVKGKGMHFAIRRLKHFLHNYYLKYGDNEGYILQFDFSKYFDHIPHQKLIDMVSKVIKDKDIVNLYAQLVNDFEGDYGLGLGSQISQISALYYPHDIDNKFSYDNEIFAYARYMDDGYMISRSKKKLQECMKVLKQMCDELEIKLNPKKTQIFKMTTTMEFLKSRVRMYPNGRITVKPNRRNVTRNRRKLKKLKKKLDDGEVTMESVKMIFKTTVGNFKYFNAYKTMLNYIRLFIDLFKLKGDKHYEKLHCWQSI